MCFTTGMTVSQQLVQNVPCCQLGRQGCSPLPVGQQVLQCGLPLLGPSPCLLVPLLQGRCLLTRGGDSGSHLLCAGRGCSHCTAQRLQGLAEILTLGKRRAKEAHHQEMRLTCFSETHHHPKFCLSHDN